MQRFKEDQAFLIEGKCFCFRENSMWCIRNFPNIKEMDPVIYYIYLNKDIRMKDHLLFRQL